MDSASGDILRCQTGRTESQAYNASDWVKASKYTDDSAAIRAENAVTALSDSITKDLSSLQTQIDGKVEVWYYSGVPTASNAPASEWTTGDLKVKHIGDVYYDTATGFCYHYTSDYIWERIKDKDISDAASAAANAKSLADGKAQIFVSTPTPPYDIGDLWVQGSSGDILRATAKRTEIQAYNAADWVLASKYTDDSTANEAKAIAEKAVNNLGKAVSDFDSEIGALQTQIDGKVEVWYYSGVPTASNAPASEWTTGDLKVKHIGDVYYDTATGFCYHYTSGYIWERIKDKDISDAASAAANAKSLADGKAQIFVSTPTPPYDIGDLWVQGSSGDILRATVAKEAGQAYAESDWIRASKYTDDSAVELLAERVTTAEQKITADAIISTVTESDVFQNDISFRVGSEIEQKADKIVATVRSSAEYDSDLGAIRSTVSRVARLDAEGLHIGDDTNSNTEVLIDSSSVSIKTGTAQFSRFASNYVQFGHYRIYLTADNGLAFSIVK